LLTSTLEHYQKQLKLDLNAKWIKIVHNDAIVATVYQILQENKPPLILKICDQLNHYDAERYCLKHFAQTLSVPTVLNFVPATQKRPGAILMEHLPGNCLNPNTITEALAFELGQSLATIHQNKTQGFGYLNNKKLAQEPHTHFTEKFKEGLNECSNHLPSHLINQCDAYFTSKLSLLNTVDGSCLIHRDFRPGNILVKNNKLQGIIDWSSARASFAEEDFFSIEQSQWNHFNGHKKTFFNGYASIRTLPEYKAMIPLLQLSRAIGIIGFTVKRGLWNTTQTHLYHVNRQFLDRLD
jgi:aminoglycoside phosphotransferase (APT) family kinase protein